MLLLSIANFVYAQSGQTSEIQVEYSHGQVNVKAVDAPLKAVFDELADVAGIDIRYLIDPGSLPTVNFTLEDQSLKQGFEFLLKNLNHMVFYDSADQASQKPKQVWILGTDSQGQQLSLVERSEYQSLDDKERSYVLLNLVSKKALPASELVSTLSNSLANDHNALVRTRAAIGLSKLNDIQALPALKSALLDESQSVRTQAILALGKFEEDEAINALGNMLQESTNSLDRNLAVRALSKHTTDLARQYLHLAGFDLDEQVRKSATAKLHTTKKTTPRHNTYTQ